MMLKERHTLVPYVLANTTSTAYIHQSVLPGTAENDGVAENRHKLEVSLRNQWSVQ